MEHKHKKIILATLALATSVFLMVSVFVSVKRSAGPTLKESDKTSQEEVGPSGKIYLSSLTFNEADKIFKQFDKVQDKRAGTAASSDVYYYDFEKGKIEKIGRDSGDKNGYINGVISPDGQKMALAGFNNVSGEWQIYLADKDGKNKQKITQSASVWKRLPRWSLDQKYIAFQAAGADKRDIETNDIYRIENWNVYFTDMRGNERVIINGGVNPTFLPDDSLLVLSPEGLRLFNKKDDYKKSVLVWPTIAKANASMKIGVSDDGQYIAWTETRARQTHIAKVSSWGSPLVFEKIKTVDGILICPVFSPDDKYLSLIEVLLDNSVTYENYDYYGHYDHRVNVYDLPALLSSDEKVNPKMTFDLRDFYFGDTVIADWTK